MCVVVNIWAAAACVSVIFPQFTRITTLKNDVPVLNCKLNYILVVNIIIL